jgi:hypothetical protein
VWPVASGAILPLTEPFRESRTLICTTTGNNRDMHNVSAQCVAISSRTTTGTPTNCRDAQAAKTGNGIGCDRNWDTHNLTRCPCRENWHRQWIAVGSAPDRSAGTYVSAQQQSGHPTTIGTLTSCPSVDSASGIPPSMGNEAAPLRSRDRRWLTDAAVTAFLQPAASPRIIVSRASITLRGKPNASVSVSSATRSRLKTRPSAATRRSSVS